ncbi:MAG: sensor domain-containing diguanylate cyclase [Deltaproteobacteria bacterium]|nr:sensor domain-containing diguanylate cyclase [Deltaproteobacteria bacterium]
MTAFDPDPRFFRTIVDELPDGVYVTDRERRIVYWNRGAERITGYTAAETLGSSCADNLLMHVDGEGTRLCLKGCPLSTTLADGEARDTDLYLQHKAGHRVPVRVRVAPLRDREGRIAGAVETFTDNSARLAALQRLRELQQLAFLDPVTGVGNRRYTELTVQARLDELRRYGWTFAVLFIDIDHFKQVNDEWGHEVGDRVLELVARTLAGSLRSFDFLGRWGGEEFVAVVPMQLESLLAPLATRCRALVERSRLAVGVRHVLVTVSIGATMADAADTVATLVARADELMYRSKRAGRNRVTLSPPRPGSPPPAGGGTSEAGDPAGPGGRTSP